MTKGPRRLVLDQYLDSATEGFVKNAGEDWKDKADDLDTLGRALKKAAQQAELRIGEQTLTGPAIRAGMEKASASLITKAEQLRAAGEALRQVGQQIADTRETRDSMKDLGTKPAAYQPPAGTPGVEPTPEELQAQADASAARQAERTSWQSAYDKQEATSLALTKEMDAAFLGAIPPMKEIHGEDDPTEPPPNVPSGPSGPYLPGTQAPPVTGAGGTGGGHHTGAGTWDNDIHTVDDHGTQITTPTPTPTPTTTTTPTTTPTTPTTTTPVHTEHPTTTVLGSSQNGVTYQPSGAQVPAPAPSGGAAGTSAAASAAAFGAAGGAGGLAAGAVRPGVAPTSSTRGASAVKPIGSTGRAGSAGSLSRSAGVGPGARGAGAPSARGASSGSASSGSASGRGSAGARGGAAGARGASTGSSGARGGAGAGGAGGRGGRKGERDRTTERDGLVYDQDWLSDDDVAPGVLD